MTEGLHRFCVLAVFCGAALRLAPEGSVRRIMSVLVSAVLMLSIFGLFGQKSPDVLLEGLAGTQEYERRFAAAERDQRQRMDRTVIEAELRSYIQNKAEQKGLTIRSVSIEMRWQTEGYWLPWSLTVTGAGDSSTRETFQRELEAELGIALDRQQWVDENGLEEYAKTSG